MYLPEDLRTFLRQFRWMRKFNRSVWRYPHKFNSPWACRKATFEFAGSVAGDDYALWEKSPCLFADYEIQRKVWRLGVSNDPRHWDSDDIWAD